MDKRRFDGTSVVSLVVLLGAACAGSKAPGIQTDEVTSADAVSIEVNNDLVPSTSITVWLVPETGSRRRLGDVNPNARLRFSYLPSVRSMDFRLIAQTTDRRDITTQPFTLTGVTSVTWNTSSPVVNRQSN